MIFFQIELVLAALIFFSGALCFYRTNSETLKKYEGFSRNRFLGLCLGFPAMIMCVPHAQVVSPAWLLPLLWPLALITPILCYYYIDYFTSRSLSGILILYAYDVVHGGFEYHLPGAAVFSIVAWIIGIMAIWIAGKPWTLRDLTRLVAHSLVWRWVMISICIFFALSAIANLFVAI